MKKQKNARQLFGIVLCFCTTFMLSIDFSITETMNNTGVLYNIIENIRQSIKNDYLTETLIFASLYYIYLKIGENKIHNILIFYIFNIVLAFLWLISVGLAIDDTTLCLYNSPSQMVKSLIYMVGATNLLNCVGNIIHHFIVQKNNTICTEINNRLRTFIIYFIGLSIVWIPNTIISHPASIECDVWDSLYQYFGKAEFTAHHPPVFTVLVGLVAKLGLMLGDVNIGFCVWVMSQTLVAAAIMAYVLYTMRIMKMPKWIMLFTFIIVALSPCYTSYVTTIVKDVPYSFALVLYIVELVYMHIDWERYWKSFGHVILYFVSNMAILLFRHNGKYLIFIMLIYLLVRCIANKKRISKKGVIRCLLLLILPLIISKAILNGVNSYYNVTVQEGESLRESLSIPFQQTARYAKYYEDETPVEEKTIIDRVIDYYALSSVYEPAISDPVKARFHYYATKEDWINYFKVWFKQFTRHPITYFEATMNQNYYLVYPFKENSRFYYSTYVDYFYDHDFMDEMGAAQKMTFDKANDIRIEIYRFLNALPVTGIFSNLAVYNILLAYLIIFAIQDKKKGFIWITIPVIVSDLVILAGPAIYDNMRYGLPVIYMMPLVVAYYVYVHNKDQVDLN